MKMQESSSSALHGIAIGIAAIALLYALIAGPDESAADQANYCEMRQIHTDSGGQYGWPVLPGYGECK